MTKIQAFGAAARIAGSAAVTEACTLLPGWVLSFAPSMMQMTSGAGLNRPDTSRDCPWEYLFQLDSVSLPGVKNGTAPGGLPPALGVIQPKPPKPTCPYSAGNALPSMAHHSSWLSLLAMSPELVWPVVFTPS